ncbi:MAG: bifunctional folylpolyglutamate synthase/dihydrofolate synthase [Parvularculaceae bacterium]|nr:bifunctional folylpolyglutamate synthase/dihydrofolate synthase [Parvularculaceae bacterium]
MRAALKALNNPQFRLPPVIHVAGTNGKGSTCAYLRAILEASGASVHAFTSPHLVRFNERIVINGEPVADDYLVDILERCDRAVGPKSLTFFEATTAAAFLSFAENPADYLVLEVGLGGRLDATNVIERPLAAAITPIALDHQQFLGETLAEIAAEKAGILREGAPAVVGPQTPEAMQVVAAHAARTGAPLFAFGAGWNVFSEHGRLIYQDDDGLRDLDPPRLLGAHQVFNAGLAVATVKAAGLALDDRTISRGLVNARWPARLQRLRYGPLVDEAQDALGPDAEIWLDGGHNPHAARAVAAVMADLQEKSPRPLVLIAGMQATKDREGYFAAFAGLASMVFATAADHDGAASPEEVAAAARKAGVAAIPSRSVAEALSLALAEDGPAPRILICGSLYLAGEVLRENG